MMDRKCKFCGGKHEFEKSKCPAFGKTCSVCKRSTHFAKVCYAAKDNKEEQYKYQKYKMNCLENKCVDSNNKSENESEWVNMVKNNRGSMNNANAKQVSCVMSVGNRIVKFQIDTGTIEQQT